MLYQTRPFPSKTVVQIRMESEIMHGKIKKHLFIYSFLAIIVLSR